MMVVSWLYRSRANGGNVRAIMRSFSRRLNCRCPELSLDKYHFKIGRNDKQIDYTGTSEQVPDNMIHFSICEHEYEISI